MSLAGDLGGWGVVNPRRVIRIAKRHDLELAAACALLEKETAGGHNLFGHDTVDTCGNYEKGAEVTKAAYLRYKADRDRCGAQGVGPTQLTWPGFQDEADERGGCWKWGVNTDYGLELFAGYVRESGMREAARRYNGAESYADDFMGVLKKWRRRVGNRDDRDDVDADVDRMFEDEDELRDFIYGAVMRNKR